MLNKLKICLIIGLVLSLGMKKPSINTKSYLTKTVSFKLVSIYTINPIVWGTYKLSKEYIYKVDKNTKKLTKLSYSSNKFLKESLLFEKNKLFIIKNDSNKQSKGRLLVKSFPYHINKNSLEIELFKNKDDFFELSYSKIINTLNKINNLDGLRFIGPDYLYVSKMDCKKGQRNYKCVTNITLSLI